MTNQNPLPFDEASGKKILSGPYHVSFDIDISRSDEISISDLIQTISGTLTDTGLIEKVSKLNVSKQAKNDTFPSKNLKVGDTIRISKEIRVTAELFEDEGYYSLGLQTENAKKLGEPEFTIEEGSSAVINKILDDGVELIELDRAVSATLQDEETDELFDASVNVDLVRVPKDCIEKIDEES